MLTAWLPDMTVFMRLRGFLYSLMMAECGRNFQLPSTVILNSLAGFSVGNDVFIGHRTIIIGTDVVIEDEVLIGPNCVISGGNHTFYKTSYRFGPHVAKPVKIMAGGWIGANCTITAGSVLPARSILAAGSVLTKAFSEPDCIYAGSPAKQIKQINREADIV